MKKLLNPLLIVLILLVLRAVIFSATIGDAIGILSLSLLLGLEKYLDHKKLPDPNQEFKQELVVLQSNFDELKSTVNGLKIARTYGK